jgi:hypothetical protein
VNKVSLTAESAGFLDKLIRHAEKHFPRKTCLPEDSPPAPPTSAALTSRQSKHKRPQEALSGQWSRPCSWCDRKIQFEFKEEGDLCDREMNILASGCCNYDCEEHQPDGSKFVLCKQCVGDEDVVHSREVCLQCHSCEKFLCVRCSEAMGGGCVQMCIKCAFGYCAECMPDFEAAHDVGTYLCKGCAPPRHKLPTHAWGSTRPWRQWPKVEQRDYGEVYVLPGKGRGGWFGYYDDGCGLQGGLVLKRGSGQAVPFHQMRSCS